MAVSIRLQRRGKKHRPFYQVVAADQRAPRDGRFIENLGTYDPNHNPSQINVKAERLQYWYGCGAQLSDQVKAIAKSQKIDLARAKTHKPRSA